MRYPTLTILTLFFLWSLSPGSPSANAQETPEKPLYQSTGNEATLTGTIGVKGGPARVFRYDMTADPICVDLNRGRLEVDDVVIHNQQLENVFVYVKSGEALKTYSFEVPESDVVLEHKNCRYSPRILGIRAGQRLAVSNSDPTPHNTHPTPRINDEWNASLAPGAKSLVKIFNRAEQFIPVKDNMHPWKRAILGVFDHPFFAVSDQFGNYEIKGLPPGKYTLAAWHERLGEQTMEITVVGGENRKIDFTFDLAKLDSRRASPSSVPSSPDK
jgi:hypothetical protein